MAYTYNLSATVRGGKRSIWDSVWDGSSAEDERRAGLTGTSTYHQCSMIFSTSSLAGKTITGINLTFTVVSGTIPGNGTNNFPICYKADSSTTSWKRSSTSAVGYIKNQTSGGGSYGASNTQMTVNMGTTLPSYGYVAGSIQSPSGSYKSVILGSTATLAVTTNETYREYTLAYNANGGSGAPGNQTAGVISVNPSCTFTVSSTVPTRTGYDFLGWSTSSTATSASYVGGNSITLTSSGTTTLYAVWKLKTYTVTYDKGPSGSGTNTTATKTYNVALTLKGATFTRTGYTQTSWYSTSPAQAFALGGSYTANADITLYPTWTLNTYQVSYNANGGTGAPGAQTKSYGVTLTLSSTKPTRASASAGSYTVSYNGNGATNPTASTANRTTSYAFKNWNTAANGSGTTYASGGSYTANAAATLYAQWTATTTTTSVTLPTPTRTGYRFDGWFTAQTGGTKITSPYIPSGNVTLYAQWTAAAATLSTVTDDVTCGNYLTATWASTGAAYKYRITITCGNATATSSGQTAAGAQTASVQVPTTWYSMSNGPLRDSMTATATCTLTTYDGNGTAMATTSSKTFTVRVPSSVVPTVGALTATSDSLNGTVAGWGADVFVQGYSFVKKLQLAVSSHGDGAVLGSVVFSGPGMSTNQVTSGSSPYSSASGSVINSAGWQRYTAVYTNSRGQSVTKTLDINFQAYSRPTITRIDVARCDSNGDTNNGSGQYIKATPVYSVSSIKNSNNVEKNPISSQTIAYKLHTAGAYGTAETCASSTMSGPWSAVTTAAYDVKVTVGDQLFSGASASSAETTIPSVQGIWFGKGNDRLGLGGVPTGPGLHVDWDAEFNGVVDMTQRRCYRELSSAGWYRVMTFDSNGGVNALGSSGAIIDISITRRYAYGVNEVHKVTLLCRYNGMEFVGEQSSAGVLEIDKIRWCYETNNTSKGHLDIHYNYSSGNVVSVKFDISTFKDYQKFYTAESLQSVANPPGGETVLTEYTFNAIATPLRYTATTTPVLVTDYGTAKFTVNAPYYDLGNIGIIVFNPGESVLQGVSFSTLLQLENLPFIAISASGFVRSLGTGQDGMDAWQLSGNKMYLRKRGGGNLVGTFLANPLLQVCIIGIK